MRIAKQLWQRWLPRTTGPAPAAPRPFAADGQRFRPRPDVVERRLGDELFLVNLSGGSVFRLNRTGVAVWELAGQRLTTGEIADRLPESWGVARDRLRHDVRALLGELVAQRLVEPVEGPAP